MKRKGCYVKKSLKLELYFCYLLTVLALVWSKPSGRSRPPSNIKILLP